MKPILEVRGISKKFKIQHEQQAYLSLRDSFTNIFSKESHVDNEFWALKDVTFDIYPGDSVGIIGRNGAGKSTLLKILSKITPPTTGKIISRGRVASLLEVGTGFHPELTGRENVYLNGSILGLKRQEIDKQFDAIVDFSGVELFLDTPLKHYSSGMQLRLAFAVAAHLEPEILIIDEVLAVGDAEFQRKCMGKMGEVSKSGRTVLFVSHNLVLLNSLCEKSILLNKGKVEKYSNTADIINLYYESNLEVENSITRVKEDGFQKLFIESFSLVDENGSIVNIIHAQEKLFLTFRINVLIPNSGYNFSYELTSLDYGPMFTSSFFDYDKNNSLFVWEKGIHYLKVEIPILNLREGEFYIKVASASPAIEMLDEPAEILYFKVINNYSPDKMLGEGRRGSILPVIEWSRKG